jgi:Protein of unknown function (DUF4038)/Domain of unknown function (DUF5060)
VAAPRGGKRENRILRHAICYCALWIAAVTPCAAVTIEQYNSYDFSYQAQASGNPFDVELAGDFIGPGGVRLSVPGFYDGNGVWKIRFSPTSLGTWSLRTRSSLPALNGRAESGIECQPNTHATIHGGLRVDPLHPHHFVYQDGTRYFLAGYEADFLWSVDMLDPQRRVMHTLIDQMASRGFNHVLVNIYAHDTTWASGKSCQWDYGPPAMYAWEGTNEKPDHSRLNTKFFQLYDVMMNALRDKGIVAHIMVKVYNKQVNWPPPGSVDEERYFKYVTARYQAYSNVVWDFAKESYNEKDKTLQKRLTDLIRSTDAYGRLLTAHDNDTYDWNPELNSNTDFRTDQQHTSWVEAIAFDRTLRNWPVVNAETGGYERGVDDLPTYNQIIEWQEVLRRAYLVYLAGGYHVYYYNNTAWDVIKPEPESPGVARFQQLNETLSTLPYWRMEPANELAFGGTCLAIPGEVYACYSDTPSEGFNTPPGGRGAPGAAGGPATARSTGGAGEPAIARMFRGRGVVLNLRSLNGPAQGEWINTWTGAREPQPIAGPGVYQLSRPQSFGEAPGLLIIRAGK